MLDFHFFPRNKQFNKLSALLHLLYIILCNYCQYCLDLSILSRNSQNAKAFTKKNDECIWEITKRYPRLLCCFVCILLNFRLLFQFFIPSQFGQQVLAYLPSLCGLSTNTPSPLLLDKGQAVCIHCSLIILVALNDFYKRNF